MTRSIKTLALAAALLLTVSYSAWAVNPAEGFWLNADQDAIIQFAPCGDAICGSIAWLKAPFDQNGKLIRDTNNPDPALTNRAVCGLMIATGLGPANSATLEGGTIYDPEDGKTYSAALTVRSPAELEITGYVGVKLLGRTETWTRVSSPPPPCGKPAQ